MIFLYRFDIVDGGINFVLNEGIVMDMLPEYEEVLKSSVLLMSTILDRYKILSKHPTIFKAIVLDNNDLDLTFSEGLGKYIDDNTKNNMIYKYGQMIANICAEIMNEGCRKAKK